MLRQNSLFIFDFRYKSDLPVITFKIIKDNKLFKKINKNHWFQFVFFKERNHLTLDFDLNIIDYVMNGNKM